ncbi:MAG: hypothetical protein NTZ50_13290 [Chloroflexi bacterium]|nr:hypothetical protein [Chloroflexota bacterium]
MIKNLFRAIAAIAAVFAFIAPSTSSVFAGNDPCYPDGNEANATSACARQIITGRVFEDVNENGKWDANEIGAWIPVWYKVTDGGNWYVCGVTAGEKYGSSYGVVIDPIGGYKDFPNNFRNEGGTYYVMPIVPPGYKLTTSAKAKVSSLSRGTSGNGLQQDIGVVKDSGQTKVDACDQYNPAR